jgi:GNAT superfamily N-acetyltransferase
MKITAITEADLPRIAFCAESCCAEHGEDRLAGKLDIEYYLAFWRCAYRRNKGIIFVIEHPDGRYVGGIGGFVDYDVHTHQLQATMVFWYILPEFRAGLHSLRLWKELEKWAVSRGCTAINTAFRDRTQPEKTKDFYEKLGFKQLEIVYRKNL